MYIVLNKQINTLNKNMVEENIIQEFTLKGKDKQEIISLKKQTQMN